MFLDFFKSFFELGVENKSYYEVSLEVVNCNELDRRLPYMTCHGLLFPKSGTVGERLDGNRMIDIYLRFVTVLGRAGIYISKRKTRKRSVCGIIGVGLSTPLFAIL